MRLLPNAGELGQLAEEEDAEMAQAHLAGAVAMAAADPASVLLDAFRCLYLGQEDRDRRR